MHLYWGGNVVDSDINIIISHHLSINACYNYPRGFISCLRIYNHSILVNILVVIIVSEQEVIGLVELLFACCAKLPQGGCMGGGASHAHLPPKKGMD